MPTADLHRWLLATLAALILQACATSANRSDAPFEISEDYANNVIRYTVQRGDRLSDIALEFTGNLNSWLPIAEHNGITDPKTLRVGSQIEIPTVLIPGYEEKRLSRRNRRDGAEANTAEVAIMTPAPSDTAPADQKTTVSSTTNESAPTVAQNSTEGNREDSRAQTPSTTFGLEPQLLSQVKVVGSYYPKGVYEQPTLDSQLMMRASPGADFTLVEQMDGWYRIETDLGQGYLRARDGRIISVAR